MKVMKTTKILVNLMFMSIVTVVLLFDACTADDLIDNQTSDAQVAGQNDELLEPLGLVYSDFINNDDVTILNNDTTLISVSKAYADKMGVSNFVNHPMGIWDKKEHAAYLRRATEQKLVDNHYVLKVVRSSIGEVVGNRDVTLSSRPYYNPNAGDTRGAVGEGSKYIDENNVIHPTAITLYPDPEDEALTRGIGTDYGTYTVEEIYYEEYETRGLGSWLKNRWKDIKNAVEIVVNQVDLWTSYDVNCPKTTVGLLHHKSKFEKKMKFNCGTERDTIMVKMECPIEFNLDYTLEVRGHGSIKTGMLPKPDYLETYVDGYFGMTPKMTIGYSCKAEIPKDKQRIKIHEFKPIGATFMIGAVPVHVNFEPNIHLQLKASVEGELYAGVKYDFATSFRAGVKYNGGWSGISKGEIVKNDLEFIKPTASFTMEFNPGLMFGVDVIVDGVAGPTFSIGPQLKCKAKMSYTYWTNGGTWDFTADASAGIGGEFGAKVKVFGWELAEWKYPFDIGPQKTIYKYPKK